MSLIKFSLGGDNLIIPVQGESLVSDIPDGDGKIDNLFLQCTRIYLSEPVGIGERKVGEGAFSLDEVPGRAHVVVPRDDPLDRVTHHVNVDWHR
jgi:hypothetical protein